MKACLKLDNGEIFEGESFGAKGRVSGELVCSTNMTGFQESLTNRNYSGKLLLQTFPLVGNVGVNKEDDMSSEHASGLIVREYCDQPSNFRCDNTLGAFMNERGIVGLQGIDTRRLAHILRENPGICGEIYS
ncbi:MAG: hypothetical protein FWF94_07250 [Oscillospiraceae bacterium]|nr:hypothetical protein [Oscillospiraceae bacterium]